MMMSGSSQKPPTQTRNKRSMVVMPASQGDKVSEEDEGSPVEENKEGISSKDETNLIGNVIDKVFSILGSTTNATNISESRVSRDTERAYGYKSLQKPASIIEKLTLQRPSSTAKITKDAQINAQRAAYHPLIRG